MAEPEVAGVDVSRVLLVLATRLRDAIKGASGVINVDDLGYVSGAIDVEKEFVAALAPDYLWGTVPADDETLMEYLHDLPETLVGLYWDEAGWGGIDLLQLPGDSAFITLPPFSEAVMSLRAIALVQAQPDSSDISAIIPALLRSPDYDQVLLLPPAWMTNYRPDLVSQKAVRSLLGQVDDYFWREYKFDPPLDRKPSSKAEFVDAYMARSYDESRLH